MKEEKNPIGPEPGKQPHLLGVLGGMGPMSTFYFCELLTVHTEAKTDHDHIDMIVSSRATTPDRTAFILGEGKEDPLPAMIGEAERLARAGAELLVIPCNTAHYFYDGLAAHSKLPILNIIRLTVDLLRRKGYTKIGLLATEGTVRSGAYRHLCEEVGMECVSPEEEGQRIVTSVIYDAVKQNRPVDFLALGRVADSMMARGCQILVLGCTELSTVRKRLPDPERYLDSLEVLAYETIKACGKTPVGFSPIIADEKAGAVPPAEGRR